MNVVPIKGLGANSHLSPLYKGSNEYEEGTLFGASHTSLLVSGLRTSYLSPFIPPSLSSLSGGLTSPTSVYALIGFGGKKIEAMGKAEINVTFSQAATMGTEVITFDIMDIQYPYNAIFGRSIINKFAAAIDQPYLRMKIPTAGGVLSIFGSQEEA